MRRRLLLVVAAATGLVVVAFAIPLGALVRDVARDRAVAAAERDAAALAPVLAVTDDPDLIEAAVARTGTGADGRLAVFTAGRQVGDPTPADATALRLAGDGRTAFLRSGDDGVDLYSPVVTGDGSVDVVRARLPDDLLTDGVAVAWAALAAVAAGLFLGGTVLADRMARSLNREVADLAGTARSLAAGVSTARARGGDTPEIADVAAALNGLADRIDELRAMERERVADLSHRLRTPLTALRLEADRAGVAALTTAVDRLEETVTAVVRQSRLPLAEHAAGTGCDLAEVVAERAAFWAALAEDDGRPHDHDLDEGPLPVAVPADEVAAAVDALLTNVFTHTPDDTPYTVTLRRQGDTAQLVVRDEGPGVADAGALAARGVSAGGSSGLGLDIVARAAQAGAGHLDLRSGPGEGFTAEVTLPLAP